MTLAWDAHQNVQEDTPFGRSTENCQIMAWITELVEFQVTRGRELLMIQREQEEIWTPPPSEAMSERGQVHERDVYQDDLLVSLLSWWTSHAEERYDWSKSGR